MSLGRNEPCWCRSGKKYKRCHLDSDRDSKRALQEALPVLQAERDRTMEAERRLRDEYGVYVNYVSPTDWQGRKVWAIGSRLYLSRPQNETFHEFLIHVLRETFGETWRQEQEALPEAEQHFVLRVSAAYTRWKAGNADPEQLKREGRFSAQPNGWVQYFISLAWDVVTLIRASNLPDELVARLRDAREFQGARYEVAVAAIFARLNCEIKFLNEDADLRGQRHVEFIATHRPSRQQIAVETKSRRRPGVLNEEGAVDEDDHLRGDPRAVRRRFLHALEQAPEGFSLMIFIDINAPLEPEADPLQKQWIEDIKRWMDRLPHGTTEEPEAWNALCVTNFAPHYQGDDLASGGEWVMVKPIYTRNPLRFDPTGMLQGALDNYHRVPDILENGEIR